MALGHVVDFCGKQLLPCVQHGSVTAGRKSDAGTEAQSRKLLNDEEYNEFSLYYINKIKASLINKVVPLIYYIRETEKKIHILKDIDIDVLGIDSSSNIGFIKNQIGNKYALQGNLDVNVLKLNEKSMRESVENILRDYNSPSGHIFNLGTGITPDINPEKVKMLIDILADISPKYNVK